MSAAQQAKRARIKLRQQFQPKGSAEARTNRARRQAEKKAEARKPAGKKN